MTSRLSQPYENRFATQQELTIIRKENPKRKTVVVSQFTSLLSMLQPLLKSEGFRYTRLDGTMNTRARSDVISEFQDREAAEGPTVLLLSLRAGGVGLNLTASTRGVRHSDFLQFNNNSKISFNLNWKSTFEFETVLI